MTEPARYDRDRLDYLADMIAEMHRMADSGNLPTLAYFLGMAHLEAQDLLAEAGASGRDRDEGNAVA